MIASVPPTGHGRLGAISKNAKAAAEHRATFLYNPNMAATAVNMGRLIALDQGFPELVPPEVPPSSWCRPPSSRRTTSRNTSSTRSTDLSSERSSTAGRPRRPARVRGAGLRNTPPRWPSRTSRSGAS
jgi:hypothetical protein